VGEEISGCEILQKTAAGGMGAVYRARHKALDRIVCVKILAPALANDKKAVDLFLTEARAIAELDHPNIVNVYNVGKEKGYYFIVMSFVEGQTLSQMLRKQKVLPIGLVLDLFEGVLLGLQAAHEKGIIHRDIKPSNILIDQNMQPKVVDFGIAKKVDKEKGSAKSTELAGTAYFIAPEQAVGKNVDTRADLYAVGASLYYVLTGHFPYNGKNTMEIIQKHIKDPIPNPANLRPDIPIWLAQAVQKLMSKKPENRFRTAKEVVDFFRKMRADDQLRLSEGNAGLAINLSQEGGLKLSNEGDFLPENKPKPAPKPIKLMPTQSMSSMTAAAQGEAEIPTLSDVENFKPPVEEPEAAQAAAPAPAAATPAPYVGPDPALQAIKAKRPLPKILKAIISLGVFTIINFLVAYVFYAWGHIGSAFTHPSNSFWRNLYAPFISNSFAPKQVIFMIAAIVCLGLIFVTAKIKRYAPHTLMLVLIALVAYVGGLYCPKIGFLDISGMGQNLLSGSCFFGYLVVSVAFALWVAKTYNRSVALGILGASLVALSVVLSYLAAHTSFAPVFGIAFSNLMFYGAILCSMCAIYYLVMPTQNNSIVIPTLTLLAAVGCMWMFTSSGVAVHTLKEIDKLVGHIPVRDMRDDLDAANGQPEELMPFVSQNTATRMFTQRTEFSSKSKEQILAVLQPRVLKMVPEETFTEKNFEDLTSFMATYYHDGEAAMRWDVWVWAAKIPLGRFSEDAPENHIYCFMLWILILFNIAACAMSFIKKEDDDICPTSI